LPIIEFAARFACIARVTPAVATSAVIVPEVVTGDPVIVIEPEDDSPTLVTVPEPPPPHAPPESPTADFVAH